MSGPGTITVPHDPKVDARRANEEAAKRLIANPPEWAYPRAWMCAVLTCTEASRNEGRCGARMLAESFAPGSHGHAYNNIKLYHDRRKAGQPHAAARRGLCWLPLVDAYARGMEKPAGLLQRPCTVMRVR